MARPVTTATRSRYRIEYGLLRGFESLLAHMPRRTALRLGAVLGAAARHAGFHRRVVLRNLEIAAEHLGDLGDRKQFLARLYANMGRYAADVLRTRPENLPRYTVEGEEILRDQMRDGRGAVVLLGHLGNWELLAQVFAPRLSMTVIGKPMRNPLVNDWIFRKRRESGAELIYPEKAVRRCLQTLRNGGLAVFLIDQYAGSRGTPAPFFGRMTSTVRTPAGLIVKTGCGAIGVRALLRDDGSYWIRIEPAPRDPASDAEDPVADLQARHNRMLEGWIREHPDHWFGWFHRRLKDCVQY